MLNNSMIFPGSEIFLPIFQVFKVFRKKWEPCYNCKGVVSRASQKIQTYFESINCTNVILVKFKAVDDLAGRSVCPYLCGLFQIGSFQMRCISCVNCQKCFCITF